jgi:signal transduction histidine kinase
LDSFDPVQLLTYEPFPLSLEGGGRNSGSLKSSCSRIPGKHTPAVSCGSIVRSGGSGFGGLLSQFVADSHPYTTLFIATAFSVWYAGLGPSLLTASVGWLGAKLFFVVPLYSVRITTREERNSTIAYSLISLAVILFGDLSRRTILKQRGVQARLLNIQEELEERIRERTALLQVTNESLRDLSAQLLRVRDEEQRKLARHLHDSTGQTLTALTMNLARLEREALKLSASVAKTATESAALAREVSDSVRTVSYLLHPPLLDEAGLESALSWYVEGFEQRSGIKIHLEMPPDFARQSSDLETAVFRIVQERLTNIHRHSESSTAEIRICEFAGGLALQVKDTGRGIPAETLSRISSVGLPGVGRRGMRERITALGGAFEILSEGKGTTVKVAIPLQAPVCDRVSAAHA